MTRLPLLAAAMVSATLLAPLAGHAADTGTYYTATPAAAPSRTMLIIRGAAWKWNETAYTAPRGPEREDIMCQLVARSAGKLSAFTAGGTAFDAAALDKCNAHAK